MYNTNGESIATFEYNEDGIRTKKTNQWGTTEFIYSGDKLIAEVKNGYVLRAYTWDEYGQPVSITTGGETYYYLLDGQ